MKRKTKIILDCIFALGIITAALSIGRAASTNTSIWKEDSTWREMPSDTFTLVEEKAGIIFASCAVLRQFIAYRQRTGTVLPSSKRQKPDADFVKMRRKVNWRNIFWYRKPLTINGRVFEAQETIQGSRCQTTDLPETAISKEEESQLGL